MLFLELVEGTQLDIPAAWMQGRSAFGGLQAAFAVAAMQRLVDDPLRTLQMTFVAPAAGTLRAAPAILRRGKSATHVEVRLSSGDELVAIAVGVFGAPRSSAAAVRPPVVGYKPDVDILLPFVEGVTPAFTQHFAARWLAGALPFSGSAARRHVLKLDMLDAGPATIAHVIALADFVPPLALSHLRAPAPGSTVTWMVQFLVEEYEAFGLDGWLVDATLAAAHDGYTSQSVTLWAPDGTPVALSHQSMLVFG